MTEHNPTIYFATGNKGKFLEASQIAKIFGVTLKQMKIEKIEIQSDELEDIASFAAKRASETARHSVVAEDAGLFINNLRGFPGPYSAYVFKTVGNDGVLNLLKGAKDRSASFRAVVSFARPRDPPVCFDGEVKGMIARKPRGRLGFGFDPIFVPMQADGRTFAEMNTLEKNLLSHRAKAFVKFFTWLTMNEASLRQVK
ncbi:MAG: XTP/dITP diphosphatase [Candidatus Bathyarchaeia archaeon]